MKFPLGIQKFGFMRATERECLCMVLDSSGRQCKWGFLPAPSPKLLMVSSCVLGQGLSRGITVVMGSPNKTNFKRKLGQQLSFQLTAFFQ